MDHKFSVRLYLISMKFKKMMYSSSNDNVFEGNRNTYVDVNLNSSILYMLSRRFRGVKKLEIVFC